MSFEIGGAAHVGVALAGGIVDLMRALGATNPEIDGADSMLAIIQSGIDIDSVGREYRAASERG